ncbi:MAG: hypothetical protein QME75_10625 [Deltaproteobacteria bacterium]|nr:hypothetical protein [Deltaproteobacteria bacterium]
MSQEATAKEYALFFRFARDNCCNYSPKGPLGKKHYCWLEPKETNGLCVIQCGKHCRWFVGAVLPLDKALEAEWRRVHDPNVLPWTKGQRTCCVCGKRFPSGNNRQLRCADCAKARRREQVMKRVRRHRLKKG